MEYEVYRPNKNTIMMGERPEKKQGIIYLCQVKSS